MKNIQKHILRVQYERTGIKNSSRPPRILSATLTPPSTHDVKIQYVRRASGSTPDQRFALGFEKSIDGFVFFVPSRPPLFLR